MGSPFRAALPLVAAVALLSGCAGSVADSDNPLAPAGPPPPVSPFCQAVQSDIDATQPLARFSVEGDGTPAEFGQAAEAVRRSNANLIAAAPGEIRADIENSISLVPLHLETLAADNGGPAATITSAELAARAQDPAYVATRQRVQAFVNENCGVDIGGQMR